MRSCPGPPCSSSSPSLDLPSPSPRPLQSHPEIGDERRRGTTWRWRCRSRRLQRPRRLRRLRWRRRRGAQGGCQVRLLQNWALLPWSLGHPCLGWRDGCIGVYRREDRAYFAAAAAAARFISGRLGSRATADWPPGGALSWRLTGQEQRW